MYFALMQRIRFLILDGMSEEGKENDVQLQVN